MCDAPPSYSTLRSLRSRRYILQFLRNDTLPRDAGLLEEMYTEASFYRLNSLRRAIEIRASSVTIKSTTRVEGTGMVGGGVRQSWPQAGRLGGELPGVGQFAR